MADEGDSKSLVRITRVGSTPTTGIKYSFKLRLGAVFLFIDITTDAPSLLQKKIT